MTQVKRFVAVNNPDWFFLNFIHYLDWGMHEKKGRNGLTQSAVSFIANLARETRVPVFAVGTGAKLSEVIDIGYKQHGA
jgi:adenylosuccinate synthase